MSELNEKIDKDQKNICDDHEEECHEHHHEHDHEECHEHHHEHDHEECHEHHHEHDHEECHEHHHNHGDECCGHDHEGHHHDEGHKYIVDGYKLVETHKHEGATVCSFEKETKLTINEAKQAMQEAFEALQGWLKEQHAIIGHVKGFIKENGPAMTFSTVGGKLNMTEYGGKGAEIGFAAIVFGPDEETLKDRVVKEFSKIA